MALRTRRRRLLCLLLTCGALLGLSACGDDAAPAQISSRDRDASEDAGLDADTELPPDGDVVGPPPETMLDADIGQPPRDAGRDARIEPPLDDDADVAFCEQDCSALATECRQAYCDLETLECRTVLMEDGSPCGSQQLTTCTARDTCQDGVCEPHHQAKDTPCGDQGHPCRLDDACDGEGRCLDKGLRPVGTACGDSSSSECDAADTCNAQGVCDKNLAAQDAPCGDQGVACRYDDACDGNGACIDLGEWPAELCP